MSSDKKKASKKRKVSKDEEAYIVLKNNKGVIE